jgi:hypothetical protein
MVRRQGNRPPAMINIGDVGQHNEATIRLTRERVDGALDIGGLDA